ncbi:hypothetical protein [Dactylosporangium sp. NPDC000521]|uniref:hypothetical protein n=1 Tax=Dactylosporangium sp. NPDC000521 TaxID=3363975 RepID=UPI0036B921EF
MSNYRPHERTASRLARWRQLASTGMPVDDIAAELGIDRRALDQMVCRARRRGHPDAIYHPTAVLPGQGTAHIIRSRAAHVRRRRTQEQR